jgi:hypothetical protein
MVTDEPPLSAAGLRFTLAAGILLTAFSCWRYGRPCLARTEVRHLLLMAFLAVLFSNACHVIAMQFVQSNTAALLNATPALWIAWLGTVRARAGAAHRGRSRSGLLVGLAGCPHDPRAEGRIPRRRARLAAPDPARLPAWSLGTIYHRNSAP